MNKNQQLELECLSLGAELEGICRHEGMAVFVKGMLPGEKGRVVITKVEKRYEQGWLRENRTDMLISRGVGTSVFPARFLCPPQIHLITVKGR